MTTAIHSSGDSSSWCVRNRDTPAPPNRGGHMHENQLQTVTSMQNKRCSDYFYEGDGEKDTALHEVTSGM